MIIDALGYIAADLRGPLGLDTHSLRCSDRPAMATGPHHALLTLVTAREPAALRGQARPDTATERHPAQQLELDLLFSFGGSDYGESLDLLARTIAHLAAHPVRTATSPSAEGATPFPGSLDQVALHSLPLTLEEQHHLWATLGAPYVPSIVYRVTVAGRR